MTSVYIYRDDVRYGPYSIEDIRKFIQDGNVSLDDMAGQEGSGERFKVGELPGLDDLAEATRPDSRDGSPSSQPSLVQEGKSGSGEPPRLPVAVSGRAASYGPVLSYGGKGGKFFVLNLINILLTLCTLGVYYFWAKAKVLKFHWRNTSFMDGPLEYHATGRELFFGFLKGSLIVVPVGVGIWFLTKLLNLQEFAVLFAYVFFILILPFLAYAKWKFILARTSWRNVRLSFTGRLGECYLIHVKGCVLTGLTLGFYYPWFRASLDNYLIGNTFYGTEQFQYDGKGGELLPKYLLGIFLTFLTCGIYSFWMIADLLRYKWDNTSVQGIRFRNTIKGVDLFLYTFLMYIMVYFSLGIAFPWAIVIFLRMKASRLSMEQTPDLDAIEAAMRDRQASSLGEGLGEAAEALSDFFGG